MSSILSKLINLAGNITGTLGLANGGTSATTKAGAFDALSPMTTAGDLIYGGTSGTGTRIAGATGVLHSTGAATPTWATIVNADVDSAAAIAGSKLVAAASGVAGAVNTTTQTMTGAKTFETQLIGKGTATNDSAAAGYIGEYFSQSKLLSAASSLTTGTDVNVTASSITLTAGDWDIRAMVGFVPASGSTVLTASNAAISVTTGTSPANDTYAVVSSGGEVQVQQPGPGASGSITVLIIPSARVSLSGSQTFFLVARASFSVAGLSVFGSYSARRIR